MGVEHPGPARPFALLPEGEAPVVASGCRFPFSKGTHVDGRANPPEPQQLHPTPPHPASPGETIDHPGVAPRAELTVAIGRALGTVVVTVHGDLNGTTSPQLAEVLRDLIDDQGNLSVVVDARDLTLSSPDGAAALAVAAHWARRHGGTLAVAHASEPLRRALRDGGVHDVLRLAD